jgi:hypothetical protein
MKLQYFLWSRPLHIARYSSRSSIATTEENSCKTPVRRVVGFSAEIPVGHLPNSIAALMPESDSDLYSYQMFSFIEEFHLLGNNACSLLKANQSFGEICRCHLQSWRISQARTSMKQVSFVFTLPAHTTQYIFESLCTNTRDSIYLFLSQCSRGRRHFMPQIARPLWSAITGLNHSYCLTTERTGDFYQIYSLQDFTEYLLSPFFLQTQLVTFLQKFWTVHNPLTTGRRDSLNTTYYVAYSTGKCWSSHWQWSKCWVIPFILAP